MDRADSILRPFHLVVILPRQLATVDVTWCGRIASDQNNWSLNLRPFFVINVYDHFRRKVINSSLRRPSFDQLFLVTKRSQKENYDHSVTNSGGHKLTYFL